MSSSSLHHTVTHMPFSLVGMRTRTEFLRPLSTCSGISPDQGVPMPNRRILTPWTLSGPTTKDGAAVKLPKTVLLSSAAADG